MRGMPNGLGQDPVVQMWPQRWKASASSGLSAAATVAPPVTARIAPPMRPRKERRVRPAARRAESAWAAPSRTSSGRRTVRASRAEGNEAVQLLEAVDGPLGGDGAVDHVNGERRSRNPPALERIGLLALVDDSDRQPF